MVRLLYPLLLISRDQNLSSVMNDILLNRGRQEGKGAKNEVKIEGDAQDEESRKWEFSLAGGRRLRAVPENMGETNEKGDEK
jgi:hypothetical protein